MFLVHLDFLVPLLLLFFLLPDTIVVFVHYNITSLMIDILFFRLDIESGIEEQNSRFVDYESIS